MTTLLAIAGPLLILVCVVAAAYRVERHYTRSLAARETDLQARIATANRLNQRLKGGGHA
ncbi:hypothetical protein AB5J49_08230 [Streptomyces sp. R28]|uniref:Uncharacterized protein n=1 Tax=Streptomyces sp. R28 TaxID=3238628 RepID=A0AB39PUY5_9ACTN